MLAEAGPRLVKVSWLGATSAANSHKLGVLNDKMLAVRIQAPKIERKEKGPVCAFVDCTLVSQSPAAAWGRPTYNQNAMWRMGGCLGRHGAAAVGFRRPGETTPEVGRPGPRILSFRPVSAPTSHPYTQVKKLNSE